MRRERTLLTLLSLLLAAPAPSLAGGPCQTGVQGVEYGLEHPLEPITPSPVYNAHPLPPGVNEVPFHPEHPYKTKPLNGWFKGENEAGKTSNFGRSTPVRYLNRGEAEFHRLRLGSDGRIYDMNGKLFDTRDSVRYGPRGDISPEKEPKAIFVMDQYGNIYASKVQEVGAFHHSSFLEGKSVAAAGELQVVDGVLTTVTDSSGHYKPTRGYTEQFRDRLRQSWGSERVDEPRVKWHLEGEFDDAPPPPEIVFPPGDFL